MFHFRHVNQSVFQLAKTVSFDNGAWFQEPTANVLDIEKKNWESQSQFEFQELFEIQFKFELNLPFL